MFQFLTAYEVGIPLPDKFDEWVAFSQRLMPPKDQPAVELGLLIARFLEAASVARFQILHDGERTTSVTMEKLIQVEAELAAWESSLDGIWLYKTEFRPHLPPAAVFDGKYHVYYDMWTARMWNHYRWARIVVNELILDLFRKYPTTGRHLIADKARHQRLQTVERLARDILTSTPSHWRHPLLGDKTPVPVEHKGGAGAGAAGLPVLLFHLKVAACAPDVPLEFWAWSYGVIECIRGDMGMQHAKEMMDALTAHKETLKKTKKGEFSTENHRTSEMAIQDG